MVDGAEYIVKANWNYVSDIIQKGGTIIGSARCAPFRTREGRLKVRSSPIKSPYCPNFQRGVLRNTLVACFFYL